MAQLKELTIYVWKRIDLLNDGKTKFHGYGWETYAWDDGTNGSMSHKDNISDIAHSIHKNCKWTKKDQTPWRLVNGERMGESIIESGFSPNPGWLYQPLQSKDFVQLYFQIQELFKNNND